MKKLLIYSTIHSPHTRGLFNYLSKSWKTDLLFSTDIQRSSTDFIYNYKDVRPDAQIIDDSENIQSISSYVIRNPITSFRYLLRGIKFAKLLIFLSRRAESVKKILAKIKPDLIYVHQLNLGIIAYLSNYRPYVITFWGSDLYRDIPKFKHRSLVQKMLDSALFIHTINSEQKEYLVNNYNIQESKIFVQNFGAVIDNFQPLKDKLSIRKKYGFTEEYLLLSARYGKNPELFKLKLIVKAFKILNDNHPNLNARLIFIHEAHKQMDLIDLVNDLGLENKVTFQGYVSGQEYIDFLRMVDFQIQLPLYDGASITVMESLSAGVPIISTPGFGTEVNIKDNFNGLLLNTIEPEEIAEKMANLIFKKELYLKLSKNATKWANKNCDRKIAMKNISDRLLHSISI